MESFEEHHIKVEKTARYFTAGHLSSKTKLIWIACHGYGTLATALLRGFRKLDPEQHFVVAPEGLSKYYLQGTEGEVGASWMTRIDRLNEIEDQVNFLNKLFQKVKKEAPDGAEYVYFGFSQGVATVCRWLSRDQVPAGKIVIWAGSLPTDVEYRGSSVFTCSDLYLVYGNEDQYLTPERIEAQEQLLRNHGLAYQVLPFQGKHGVYSNVLKKLSDHF